MARECRKQGCPVVIAMEPVQSDGDTESYDNYPEPCPQNINCSYGQRNRPAQDLTVRRGWGIAKPIEGHQKSPHIKAVRTWSILWDKHSFGRRQAHRFLQ